MTATVAPRPDSPKPKARRQGNIARLGPDRWLVRVTIGAEVDGRRPRVNRVVRGSKADAQAFLADLLNRYARGVPVAQRRLSLGEWLAEWMAHHRPNIAPRTRQDAEQYIARDLPPELLCIRLGDLTRRDFHRLVATLKARGWGRRTIEMRCALVRNALNRAVREELLDRNVASGIELGRPNRVEQRAITNFDDARRFRAAARTDKHGVLWEVMLTTGLRPGEALAVRWADLNWADGVLTVSRALVRLTKGVWHFEPTKTRQTRCVALLPDVLQGLREHKAAQATTCLAVGADYRRDLDLVFATAAGLPLHGGNLIKRHYKQVLARAGLPPMRLYDLRHSAASLLYAADVSTLDISRILGHSTPTLTQQTYIHLESRRQRMAANALGQGFNRPAASAERGAS